MLMKCKCIYLDKCMCKMYVHVNVFLFLQPCQHVGYNSVSVHICSYIWNPVPQVLFSYSKWSANYVDSTRQQAGTGYSRQ